MRRIGLAVVLAVGFVIALFAAEARAQQSSKVARIGFLGPTSAAGFERRLEALRAGLRDLGYTEGENIVFEYRWAEGKYERLPELAVELVRLKVDVIVIQGIPGALAAKRATTTIPIVMASVGDAVATGLVASLARPGGNITGVTNFINEVMAKRIELLKDVMPRIRRVAVLLNPSNPVNNAPIVQAMELTAKSLTIELDQFGARGPDEFDSALASIAKKRVEAVIVQEDPVLNTGSRAIADLAAKHRLPSIGFSGFAEAGGLIGYGADLPESFRRAAYFVDKILKGAKPADLPVERARKFELAINLKTAKTLGLTIPPSLLLRADHVIE